MVIRKILLYQARIFLCCLFLRAIPTNQPNWQVALVKAALGVECKHVRDCGHPREALTHDESIRRAPYLEKRISKEKSKMKQAPIYSWPLVLYVALSANRSDVDTVL